VTGSGNLPMTTMTTAETSMPAGETSETAADSGAPAAGFQVHLDVFEGPFDLLLALISKHKLDITEIALSYFLVVAATLLDLKAARLLPSGEVDDEEDLALLEARDLLFARLLQYRAYKEVADVFSVRLSQEGRRYPRRVPMEPRFAELLPEVLIGIGAAEFAVIAARVLAPRPPPSVSTAHLHVPRTSVREQAEILLARLRKLRRATFRQLIADTAGTYEVVARFLAVLELFRDGLVSLDQVAPLGDLYLSWTDRGEQGARHDHEEYDG
jgi:segregation and condensation protein A